MILKKISYDVELFKNDIKSKHINFIIDYFVEVKKEEVQNVYEDAYQNRRETYHETPSKARRNTLKNIQYLLDIGFIKDVKFKFCINKDFVPKNQQ